MSDSSFRTGLSGLKFRINYGWVIVFACLVMMGITYGLMYSYSVFFKPLADHFNWDRATVSGIYSTSLLIRGILSIGVGWLADRYGPAKLMAFCGFSLILGMVLTSQVTALWQMYITYSLIQAVGLSGTFGIVTAVTSRWFVSKRGLALGIISSGAGLGTLIMVPTVERVIYLLDWSKAFIIVGVVCGLVMMAMACLLKPVPQTRGGIPDNQIKISEKLKTKDATLRTAIRNSRMLLLIAIFALIFYCTQTVMVHLVNYATDTGISPLVAASFVSTIGIIGIGGRLTMGVGADRIGVYNTFLICGSILAVSLVFLIFTRSIWSLYLFAVLFGFAYGGEVPQIPLFISQLFGTKSMATLMGLLIFLANIGGSLGAWMSGKLFDLTQAYQWSFIAAALAGVIALLLAVVLRRDRKPQAQISS